MRKYFLIITVVFQFVGLCACQGNVEDRPKATITTGTIETASYEETLKPTEPYYEIQLTEQELNWFNTEFFTSQPNEDGTTTFNIRNKFLLPFYESPEQIDLWAVFYDGISQDIQITQEEMDAFDIATGSNDPLDNVKIPREDMERLFLEYTGITVDQSEKVGMDTITYLQQWDAYYLQHSDSGYMRYEIFDGYRTEDGLVVLYYKEEPTRPARMGQVILKPNGDSFWFVSNQPIE